MAAVGVRDGFSRRNWLSQGREKVFPGEIGCRKVARRFFPREIGCRKVARRFFSWKIGAAGVRHDMSLEN